MNPFAILAILLFGAAIVIEFIENDFGFWTLYKVIGIIFNLFLL